MNSQRPSPTTPRWPLDRSVSSTFGHDKNTLPSQNLRPRPTGKQRHSAPASAPSHDIQGQWPPLSSNKQQAQTAHVGRCPGLPPSKVETSFDCSKAHSETTTRPLTPRPPAFLMRASGKLHRYALPLFTIIVALVVPYRGEHSRAFAPVIIKFAMWGRVLIPGSFANPCLGWLPTPCMHTCAGWSNRPKNIRTQGRHAPSFTRDPGGLVQQHQAPVACFHEIKRGLPPLPNSSSHIREKLKRPTPILRRKAAGPLWNALLPVNNSIE